MWHNYKLWTELPYAGETLPPSNPEEPLARFWTMYYLKKNAFGFITDLDGKRIKLAIQKPNTIDWQAELSKVKQTLNTLSEQQITIAKYWGTGVPTKQWTPIIDRLIDTYGVTASRASRILAAVHAGINDIMVVTWLLKYHWLVARPNQLDNNLATILCTPRHPTYPAGHATVSGTACTILSYFFPAESDRLKELALECCLSRLYAGVHFWVDNEEGLRLGNQIGQIIADLLKNQNTPDNRPIDTPYTDFKDANMPPPEYKQVIDFKFQSHCTSKTRT